MKRKCKCCKRGCGEGGCNITSGGAARRWLLAVVACLCALASLPALSQTLRWAARGDAESMDPHTVAETLTIGMAALVHDSLVERDRDVRIVPGLATSWKAIDPKRWRFELRRGVVFHDGSPFTADDVVFSILRAQQPSSQLNFYAGPLGTPVRIDDYTVELRLERPDPILLQHLSGVMIMSRTWAAKHHAERVPNFRAREESFSSRNANGTGRYRLVQREPGVRTVLERNPAWWGRFEGNVQKVVFTPIANDASRTAALLGGSVDFVNDLAVQDVERARADPSLRVTVAPENRLVFLGFDLWREESPYVGVKGANPLRDARVREAFAYAIDTEAIKTRIMRGYSVPARCMAVALAGCMVDKLDVPLRPDVARARKLMAEAGYEQGFDLTLDCPNDRYVNDQAICVALVGMLARIDVRLKVDARPKTLFFPKVQSSDTSFYLLGWAGSFADAQPVLDPLVHSRDDAAGKGAGNFGRIADPALDRLIDAAGTETDPERRSALIGDAQRRVAEQFYYLPLHRQTLFWASRANVHTVTTPNGVVRADWIWIE
ncbi:ABC transporter substrate-binding protein [soil metagenome]